jgi:hypothetical protein
MRRASLPCRWWALTRRAAGVLLAIVNAVGLEAAFADNVRGAWLSPQADNWPLIPIHAALTPDGRVLTYGTTSTGWQTGYFIYDVWDPKQGLNGGHVTLSNLTGTDLFCSAQIILPQDGRMLLVGGDNWDGTRNTNTGNNDTNLYKYSDDTLSRGPDMNRARWYATTTMMVNGEIYIQGGYDGEDRPEVRDANGNMRLLSNVNTSGLDWWYPRNVLAPNGQVFGYDVMGIMYYVNPAGTGQYTPLGQLPWKYRGKFSTAALFRPGKILHFGAKTNEALVIDFRSGTPVLTPTQSLSTVRQWANATVLADGRVLATGGSAVANELVGINNAAEIWDPATGRWTLGASGSRARLYHSGALLLPDATVLVHGGGSGPGPIDNLHAEIYYPPYLYDSSGAFRPRPMIIDAPSTIELGSNFSVISNTGNVTRVTLLKFGSVTHSFNMEQRFLELTFTQASTTSFVQAPVDATDAPPGYYLLFVFDGAGVPSVAATVRINVPGSTPPGPETDQTPTIGGTDGSPFTIACNASEALVGVYGRMNDKVVKRIGLRCARIDSQGRWVGDPIDRGAVGGDSGTSYARTCARDFAIAGFKGYAGSAVNRLSFECRAIDVAGKATGAGEFLEWVGGSGGKAKGPFRCGSDHPGFALAGRASGKLNALNLQCRDPI